MSDASTYDEVCINCGETDQVPGGWGRLADPCPVPPEQRKTLKRYYEEQGSRTRDTQQRGLTNDLSDVP